MMEASDSLIFARTSAQIPDFDLAMVRSLSDKVMPSRGESHFMRSGAVVSSAGSRSRCSWCIFQGARFCPFRNSGNSPMDDLDPTMPSALGTITF